MGDGERTGVELRYGRTCLLESRQATGVCLFVSLATLIVLVAGCSRKEVVEKRFYPMGGLPFMVKAYNVPENLFEETFAEIKDETERLEKLFSNYIEDGQLSTLNQAGEAKVDAEVMAMLRLASRISGDSNGAFDVTVGPLVDLWKFCAENDRRPSADELGQALAVVDWKQITLSSSGQVSFRKKNMSVDLGGIAKGYIADAAARRMKKQGIRRGIVDAGGDLVLFNSIGEEPFRIGVKDPTNPQTNLAVVELDSGAVVTSGCYERYYQIRGTNYCHIVDPRTGEPVTEMASATIVAEEAAAADALATAVMVLGKEKGMALIKSLPGVEGILVWEGADGVEWWISSGLHGKVTVTQ